MSNAEKSKEWKRNNPEKVKEYSARWRAANLEKCHANLEEWKSKNPNYNKKYYAANKEKCKKRCNDWKFKHPGYLKEKHERDLAEGKLIANWLETNYGGVPCLDCDTVFTLCAMDFDHRPEETKCFEVSTKNARHATPKMVSIVEKEIAKCDLVCSNCHRVRTFITRKK